MSFLFHRGVWMLNSTRNLHSLVRTITTFAPKYGTLANLSQSLESYCQQNPNETLYSMNREIDDLIKSGRLEFALKVFDEMPLHDVVTFNLMISGHRRYGHPRVALWFYAQMVSLGIRESPSTFSSVLGVCIDAGFYRQGIQVQCRAVSLGLGANVFIGSSVINLCMRLGDEDLALKLFDELSERNLATWNLVLRGLCDAASVENMLVLFPRMKSDGLEPNGVSFSYLIRGCGNGRCFDEGKQLHCHVVKLGWSETNIFVANALVDFYSACESLSDARKAFEAIPPKDVISWNSVVWVYASYGLVLDALRVFSGMQFWGNRPSIRSLVGLLIFASGTEDSELGKQIHSHAVKVGFDCGSVHTQSSLINMYGKCGEIEKAMAIYRSVEQRTLECRNSLMTSLLRCGCVDDSIEIFGSMLEEGTGLDEVTLSTTLKALSVSSLASPTSFKSLHSYALKSGLDSDIAVSSSLIDAYSKCGLIELSQRVFGEMPAPNVVCFTSIINGYAQNGMGKESLDLFQAMIRNGLRPDRVTFLCVLNGCNHSGLVREGKSLFESMQTSFNISPDRQHYSCMVDLLGRAGLLEEAEELLNREPLRRDSTMWSSLLRSCRLYNNEALGRRAAKVLLELEPDNPAVYLQASRFYSDIGEFETAREIQELAMARKVMREIGHSWIQTGG